MGHRTAFGKGRRWTPPPRRAMLRQQRPGGRMQFDFDALSAKDRYKLITSTVVPRPIAWVVTQSAAGVVNAAPYSFFNAVSNDPPLLSVSMGSPRPGADKDSAANIREGGQFVVNLVNEASTAAMVVTAIEFGPETSEVAQAGLATVPSLRVAPPRIAGSPVAFECERYQVIDLPNGSLVLGRILCLHVADEAVLDADRCYIDTPKLDLVGRMHGGGWYARIRDQFEIPRLSVAEWEARPTGTAGSAS